MCIRDRDREARLQRQQRAHNTAETIADAAEYLKSVGVDPDAGPTVIADRIVLDALTIAASRLGELSAMQLVRVATEAAKLSLMLRGSSRRGWEMHDARSILEAAALELARQGGVVIEADLVEQISDVPLITEGDPTVDATLSEE